MFAVARRVCADRCALQPRSLQRSELPLVEAKLTSRIDREATEREDAIAVVVKQARASQRIIKSHQAL